MLKRAAGQRIASTGRVVMTAVGATILLVALTIPPAAAQSFTVVHSFTGGADGNGPSAGLTHYSGETFYGGTVTSVFRQARQGNGWTVVPTAELPGGAGGFAVNGRLTVGPDGALYGATAFGGFTTCNGGLGCGVIFKLTPPANFCRGVLCYWNETVLYSFAPSGSPNTGYEPTGGLVFDGAGNMYGTANEGGQYGYGTVFELSPSASGWTASVLHSFSRATDGSAPNGSLAIDGSGNLYGTTYTGGDLNCAAGAGCGVVFELSHSGSEWVETVLHTFEGVTDGALPYGGLIADSAGNLYGGAGEGGAHQGGTVYELTPSHGGWTFNLLYALTGTASQAGPVGLLALDSRGNIFGATNSLGDHSYGNVFELSLVNGSWNYRDLHDFEGPDGEFPPDGPTLDASGDLIGTTGFGGNNSCQCGVIWEITP